MLDTVDTKEILLVFLLVITAQFGGLGCLKVHCLREVL